ncbi:hypothetical protein DdX_22057 [Ditylenchus destructor]|uniref:Uncharacterized protein n=1 Tax=Ditylenchus destructor TaxID=166010 RepID=A0AAD4ME26_9BILA|nr:hypothetical protein DdX_22057 [Ditylenchus destructor]
MFNKELSPEEYNEWIVRNGYSKQIPLEGQIAGNVNAKRRGIYQFRAVAYRNPNHGHDTATAVSFYALIELKDETWPSFQHIIRLLTDPFICIRTLSLYSQKVFTLLAGAMNPDQDRLQCKQLNIRFNGDTQKFIVWIKDHVRCDEFQIHVNTCTSAINVINYDLSNVIVDLIQKFMGLKTRDEYQMVASIRGDVIYGVVEKLTRNCTKFIEEEEQYEDDRIRQVIGFINNDIEKKLTLDVEDFSFRFMSFSIKITNL